MTESSVDNKLWLFIEQYFDYHQSLYERLLQSNLKLR